MRMRHPHDALGRRYGAEHVRHVRDRDQPDLAVGQLRLERVHVELAGIGDRRDAQLDARASSRSICQGTMLEWCSISEISTAWPGFSTPRP